MKKIYLLLSIISIFNVLGLQASSSYGANKKLSKEEYRFQVNFDTASSVIKSKYAKQVKEFAIYLKNHPNVSVQIEGHTDSVGKNNANKKLSERRAKSVKNKLVAYGAKSNKIKTIGYGERKPIAKNTTAEGMFENRRVVAKIIKGSKKALSHPGVIEGRLIDSKRNKALSGVSVNVYTTNNKLVAFTTTGSNGWYKLRLDAGKYILKFVRVGYSFLNIKVTVSPNRTKKYNRISMKYIGVGANGGVNVDTFRVNKNSKSHKKVAKNRNTKQGNTRKSNKPRRAPVGTYECVWTVEVRNDGYITLESWAISKFKRRYSSSGTFLRERGKQWGFWQVGDRYVLSFTATPTDPGWVNQNNCKKVK